MPQTVHWVCLFMFCFYCPAAPVCVITVPREALVLFFRSVCAACVISADKESAPN